MSEPIVDPFPVQPPAVTRPTSRRHHWVDREPGFNATYPELDPPTYGQMTRLVRAAQAGDVVAFQSLWLHFARLTYAVISRFYVPPGLFDDALQAGVVGLARAIQKFDIDRLCDFSTYGWQWIFQAIQRDLSINRFDGYTPAHLYAEYAGFRRKYRASGSSNDLSEWFAQQWAADPRRCWSLLRIHTLFEARRFGCRPPRVLDAAADPTRVVERAEVATHVQQCLDRLLPRERDVLMRRYGIGGHFPQTLEEIGTVYGITRERIRQVEAKAESRMRFFLQSYAALDPGWLRPYVRTTPAVPDWTADEGETAPPPSLTIPPDPDPPAGAADGLWGDSSTSPDPEVTPTPGEALRAISDAPWPNPSPNSANCSASCSSSTTPTSTSASTAS